MQSSIIPLLSFAGNFVLVVAIVIIFWRRGVSTASKEVIELRDKQVEAFKDEIKRLDEKIRNDREKFTQEIKELTGNIGKLTGQLESRDTENKRLTELLQNRNPEMEEFFKQFRAMLPVIQELAGLMKNIDAHLAEHK